MEIHPDDPTRWLGRAMGEAPQSPVLVLVDGVCNLCNGAVPWLLARDDRGRLSFASLQWQAARRALDAAGVTRALPASIVRVDNGRVYTRSDAVLRFARRLGLPWSLVEVLRVPPRLLRDALCDWIARHRYAWFGKRDACLVLTSTLRRRFVDADEPSPSASAGSNASTKRSR